MLRIEPESEHDVRAVLSTVAMCDLLFRRGRDLLFRTAGQQA
jgi:hypothetical protein